MNDESEPGGGCGDGVEGAPRRALGGRVGRRPSELTDGRRGWPFVEPSRVWRRRGCCQEEEGARPGRGSSDALRQGRCEGERMARGVVRMEASDAPHDSRIGQVQLDLLREPPLTGRGCVARRRLVLVRDVGVSLQRCRRWTRRRVAATPVPLLPATGLLWPRNRERGRRFGAGVASRSCRGRSGGVGGGLEEDGRVGGRPVA